MADNVTTELPLPPPRGQQCVDSEKSLRSKGILGTGMEEFFERVSLHRQLLSEYGGSQ